MVVKPFARRLIKEMIITNPESLSMVYHSFIIFDKKHLNMNIFRFKTNIPKNRTIKIPRSAHITDKPVEIIILSEQEKNTEGKAAQEFVDNWAGFLQNFDPDNLKSEYLSEKYK